MYKLYICRDGHVEVSLHDTSESVWAEIKKIPVWIDVSTKKTVRKYVHEVRTMDGAIRSEFNAA